MYIAVTFLGFFENTHIKKKDLVTLFKSIFLFVWLVSRFCRGL